MPLSEGQTFAGYRIVRLLGSGGMGEVYLAEHPRLPRRDALKVLPADVSADPEYRARFNREADLASTLWHPHIVSVHDRGECEGQLWISMEYVEGHDAAALLAEKYPAGMPVDLVVRIVTAVASALDYAHKQGLLHRDIKPANIMLTHPDDDGEQRILLADFGIARNVDDISGLTTTNMTVGTVAYSAPEQLMGEEVDGRADEYALAATAYHLLTGSQLFPHSNPAVVISRHLNSPPPALADTRPELVDLDPVLATALAKDPAGRFSSCSDFARAFAEDAPARGRAASAAPTTPAHIARKSRWRAAGGGSRGRMITVTASLAAVLLIGVVMLGWHALQQRQPSAAKTPSSTAAGPLSPSAAPPAARSTTPVACGVNNDADQVYAAMDTFVRANPTFAFSGAVDQLPGNGNFDPCATLSTIVIVPRVGTIESYRQALMFHRGQYIGPATVVPYGFISFNATATTDNQVVLNFRATEGSCSACNDAVEVPVRFRWMDGRMAMLDTPPNLYRQ